MRWNILAVLLTAVVVVVLLLLSADRSGSPVEGALKQHSSSPVQMAPEEPTSPEKSSPRPQAQHGDRIRTCTAPDGSTVYTNVLNCDDLDHSQRISVIEAPRSSPRTTSRPEDARRTVQARPRPGAQNSSDQCGKQSLHLFVPNERKVPQSCKWSWGRAQELERMLSAAKEPGDSIWLKEYCERLREVKSDGCRIDTRAFCYEELCLAR